MVEARDASLAGVQTLSVYEINERDKGSPLFLPFGGQKQPDGTHRNGLGDLVPFSNKVRSTDQLN
jgi:allene oxide cyclase